MFNIDKYNEYDEFFQSEHEASFELLSGVGKIMVSAPHSVWQTRNGRAKYAEPQTGIMAKILHDSTGCPVIYKTKNCNDDANYDENSPYKEALAEYVLKNDIKFLIDLHQLAPRRKEKIDIGTGKMKNLYDFKFVNLALEAFTSRNIGLVQIDKPFNASYPYTVSSFISRKCNIPCMQIEINSNLIRFGHKSSNVENVYYALKELLELIGDNI